MPKLLFSIVTVASLCSPAYAGHRLSNIDVVAIDAGHGDEDSVMPKIVAAEKSSCRQLATALKEIIERENGGSVKTVFTGQPGAGSSQRDRAYAANSSRARVYISLHGFPDSQPYAGIYVANPPEDGTDSWKNAGGKFLSKSSLLAYKIKMAMEYANTGKKYFVGTAPLTAFHGVAMPAVAIEAVPLSSSPANLPPEYLATIAYAIYSGLVEYGKNQ